MIWTNLVVGVVLLALMTLVLAGLALCERGYPAVGIPTLLAGVGTLWQLLSDEHEDTTDGN